MRRVRARRHSRRGALRRRDAGSHAPGERPRGPSGTPETARSVVLKESLLLIVALYAVFAATAFFVADRLIFLPPASSYAQGELPVVLVPSDGGARIATLHLPNDSASLTILYSHGNAEDLGHLVPLLRHLQRAGFSVLAYDYRGYGLSTGGPPSARGAYHDLRAVYRYAVQELGVDPARLVLLGRSVGAGPAAELAAREPVGGLVLESAFVSAFRVLTRVPVLPFDRFPNLRHIRDVECPVLIVHGTEDEVIAPWHGQRLYDAAPDPKQLLWIQGARHNDLVSVAGVRYLDALRSFAAVVRDEAEIIPHPPER
jgi:abhydrolase domain-containing protein 17